MKPGSWILVTGASAGIGKALTAALSAKGYNVVAAVRDVARVASPAGRGLIKAVYLDFTKLETVEVVGRELAGIVGDDGLAGLVNVAGIIVEGPIEGVPIATLRQQFEINVVGPVALTQAALPLLEVGRGIVVNIGATSARLTPPFFGPIAASKAALASLSDAMRLEFAPLGIRVALIEPGAMRTDIFSTSRTLREKWLGARPEVERRYRPALAAMERSFARVGADDPMVVVDAVFKALERRNSSPRVLVGKGSTMFALLSLLPIGIRDGLVRKALGLGELLKPAA